MSGANVGRGPLQAIVDIGLVVIILITVLEDVRADKAHELVDCPDYLGKCHRQRAGRDKLRKSGEQPRDLKRVTSERVTISRVQSRLDASVQRFSHHAEWAATHTGAFSDPVKVMLGRHNTQAKRAS